MSASIHSPSNSAAKILGKKTTGVDIHLLYSFYVFNDSPNITSAAERLGMTQPALSKQLKTLEAYLPQPVFSFSGRKKILTSFGMSLHERMKDKLGSLQSSVQDVAAIYADPMQARLRISARLGILDRIAEQIQFAGCLTFHETTNEQVISDLIAKRAEIGITHSLPDSHELIAKPLFKEEFQILVPKKFLRSHKSYGKTLLQTLKTFPCIDFKDNDVIIRTVCAANSVDSTELKVSRITPNYARIAKLVELGLGWAIIPSYLEVDRSRTWTISLPTDVITLRKFFIVYRSEFVRVKWLADVVHQIREVFLPVQN